ncbi:MAG: hypothetical protein SFY95_01500 [Planctomycetota bacterium]|nr:hypothetical protein [Planctomycetota bacterium]
MTVVSASMTGSESALLSGFRRLPGIETPWRQPSPAGSDPYQAFLRTMYNAFDQAEGRLFEWFRSPAAFADEDTDQPSLTAIQRAIHFVQLLRSDAGYLRCFEGTRLRGVSIGTAGSIILEFGNADRTITCSFEPDGTAEQIVIADGQILRGPITLPLI